MFFVIKNGAILLDIEWFTAMNDFFTIAFASFYQTLSTVAWFIVPVFFVALFWRIRLFYIRSEFLKNVKWEMLEIRFPADNVRTPKSMEHVFTTLYGIYSFGIKSFDKYLDGKVELWISFEIVGRADGIHFFIRLPAQRRNMVEAALYAQYPEAEIIQAHDYTTELPSLLPNDAYDIFGAAFELVKKNPYPIRTYDFFEERNDLKNEKGVDPLSPLFEIMSKLKGEEQIWIQLLVSPTGKPTGVDIAKDAEKEIKELLEKKGIKPNDTGSLNLSGATANTRDIIKAIENKISKHIFEFTLRFIYIDKKDTFDGQNWGTVMAAFQQFNTQTMNALKPTSMPFYASVWGKIFPWYKKSVVLSKKRMIYDSYVARYFGVSNRMAEEELPVVNTEELATLFHAPANVTRAPRLQKIDSRKGSPPPNLPLA